MNKATKEHFINAELQYLVPSDEKPVYYASQAGKEAKLNMSGNFELRSVPVHDARHRSQGESSLDKEGFMLTPHASTVKNFYDEKEI